VSFTDTFKVISKWGAGAKDLVAAMEKAENRGGPGVVVNKMDAVP
jgi:hypothetical protein